MRKERKRRHRRAVHRGSRTLCRRARQQPPAVSCRSGGGEFGNNGRQQVTAASPPKRPSTTPATRNASALSMDRRRTLRSASDSPHSARRQSASTERSGSMAMRASTSVSRPTARPISSRRTPTPEIAKSQEFAAAALHDKIKYPELLQRIPTLGISRAKAGVAGRVKAGS